MGRRSVMRRVPIGVIGVITPWNFPLVLALRSIAPALVLGNAVVLKADPNTAIAGGLVLGRLFAEAGLPAGVLHVVPGDRAAGAAIPEAREIGMVSFTGSTAAGRKVGAAASANLKRVALELGGNSAFIVLDDADIEAASSAGAFGSFFHQGQICMASSRHIVHESIFDSYVEALARRAGNLHAGDPTAEGIALGPIINAQQFQRLSGIVGDSLAAGANAVVGGHPEDPFFPATVLNEVTPEMRVWNEEIFGPVAPVMSFSSDAEAIAMANDTEYGLSSGIYTADSERGRAIAAGLQTGMVHIGDQTVNDVPGAPFGGNGASGNGGRFGGSANLEEFMRWQWVTERDEPATYPF
jgi:benzaldehyde dehydrogenase (NAD)